MNVAVTAPLRWGIAGYGWLARDYADPALRSLPNARLTAAYDPDPRALALARKRGLAAYGDVDAFARAVDAVYVAAPNDAHRTLVERAAALGKHVLCEKPMAVAPSDGDAMLDACARAGVAYATAYDQRHHPAHVRLRELVRDGALGTVTAVRIVYACWLAPDWAPDNWRIDRGRSGGGALVDLAPHGLDLAGEVLDDRVVAARAMGQRRVHAYGVDDGAMIVARTQAGVLVQLHVAYNHPETLPRRRLEVLGTVGIACAENTMGQSAGGSLVVRDAASGTARTVAFDGTRSPFVGLVASFTDAVLAGKRLNADGARREREALRLLERLQRDVDASVPEFAACR